ncbi:MAG: DUF4340 domain-containing protein [Desulfobaccales bacterium]|nr:DUF4340 domain-containing protein [Desulfobaccales bacterium]
MTPRRLLPYLLLFLALAGTYVGLKLRQDRQEARKQEANKIFQVKEGEISEVALIKGNQEIRLVKKDQEWHLSKPLETKADQQVVVSLLTTLAHLQKTRDLGAGVDLKPFGMEPPGLLVEFAARGKPHRLSLGAAALTERSYYALKDQERSLFLISAGDKNSLDRPILALRDKTLMAFSPDKVEAIKIKTGNTSVELARPAPQIWRWVGQEGLKVRGDRVEGLLRLFSAARVKDFVAEAPKDLRAYGLAPKPQTEVTVVTDKGPEVLTLGAKSDKGIYAKKGGEAAVVLVDQDLPEQIVRTLSTLEDRRVWPGPVTEVHKVVWGPKDKTWVAVKEKNSWKISGPAGQQLPQPAGRLEAALWRLSRLEYDRLAPKVEAAATRENYLLEIYDGAGERRFRLEELGKKGEGQVAVRTQAGDKTATALMPLKDLTSWQEEMAHLTAPPEEKE